MVYSVDILGSDLSYKATIQNLVPIDTSGNTIDFYHQLSGVGKAKIRVSTKDPLFASEGDILQPYANHIRIRRSGGTVWQGVIVNNPHRTKSHIDVEARTYVHLLDKILIRHDTPDGNGAENYRTLGLVNTTMAAAITTLINECKSDSDGLLSHLTVGTIDNPTFPANFKDSTGAALTGAWTFQKNFQIKFDYRSLFYVIQQLALYCNFDFEVTDDMTVNFKSYIGNKQPSLVFSYGESKNLDDYDIVLDGLNQANSITGLAADNDYKIIHSTQTDTVSVNTYGKLQGVAAFADVKSTSILDSRLREELRFNANPDAEVHIFPSQNAYPLGQYNIGDTITVNIQDHLTSINKPKRIVLLDVKVHNTGADTLRLVTNTPRDEQT